MFTLSPLYHLIFNIYLIYTVIHITTLLLHIYTSSLNHHIVTTSLPKDKSSLNQRENCSSVAAQKNYSVTSIHHPFITTWSLHRHYLFPLSLEHFYTSLYHQWISTWLQRRYFFTASSIPRHRTCPSIVTTTLLSLHPNYINKPLQDTTASINHYSAT